MADSSQDIEDLHKVEEDTERIRELTEKGKEQYEECINAYRIQLIEHGEMCNLY
jgi:hypothetical protein